MGSLDVYHILYTQPIRVSMGSLDSSHTAEPLFFPGKPSMELNFCRIPIRISNRHDNIM